MARTIIRRRLRAFGGADGGVPSADTPDQASSGAAARAVNRLLEHFSTLLLFCGLALLLVGAGVQISRSARTRATEALRPAPQFRTHMIHAAAAAPGGSDASAAAQHSPRRIEIPAIAVDSPIVDVGWEARIVNGEFQGNVWQTADYAAGLHTGSAPLGVAGNTVISGHNNIAGAVFKDLYLVDIGDPVLLYDEQGTRYDYEVVESFVVREEGATESERRDNTQWIRPSPDERITLITCFPPWSNTHRAIVIAFPLEAPPEPRGPSAKPDWAPSSGDSDTAVRPTWTEPEQR